LKKKPMEKIWGASEKKLGENREDRMKNPARPSLLKGGAHFRLGKKKTIQRKHNTHRGAKALI